MAKKKKDKLKDKLYKLIDSIEDEELLQKLNEEMAPYITHGKAKKVEFADDDLTEEQLKELDEAIKEADRGETISLEEFRKEMERWLTK